MNRVTLEELRSIIPILSTKNTQKDDFFDYLRIVDLNKKQYEEKTTNLLYFFSYNTEEEIKAGWYTGKFDLREHANEIIKKYPQASFVIEQEMEKNILDPKAKYIVVKNIPDAIDCLFQYIKEKSHAKVISVTGSVGKTATVGLIEEILKSKYRVLRIYSKRITPIILKANIINFLDNDIDFIVLENSLYYHDHVKELCKLLNPDVACILNIKSSHLNIDILKTLEDICIYKSEILKKARIGFINGSDNYLRSLTLKDGNIEYNKKKLFKTTLEQLISVNMNEIKVHKENFIINDSLEVTPFILSNLSKIQYLMAYKVAKIYGINDEDIENSLNNYQPVENRLHTEIAFGKYIIFDGDITTYERMQELANTLYDEKYLILRKVGCSEIIYHIEDITDHFDAFKKVFIFDDIEYLDELKKHPKVEIVNNHGFMKELSGKIIYHYSGYYRTWKNFDENNLKIYDKEKYVIKRG